MRTVLTVQPNRLRFVDMWRAVVAVVAVVVGCSQRPALEATLLWENALVYAGPARVRGGDPVDLMMIGNEPFPKSELARSLRLGLSASGPRRWRETSSRKRQSCTFVQIRAPESGFRTEAQTPS